jgi:AcrR family transcriptional regulator
MGRKKTISDAVLLDIARQIFVKEGIGASTKRIAREAGVSEGVIFQRFPTKNELFFAAMIPPPVSLKQLFRSRSRGRALIEKVTLAMLDYCRDTLPILLQLMTHPAFRFEEFARRRPDASMIALRRELVEFMMERKATGQIGDIDAGAAALLVWSTAQAIAFFERVGAHGGRFDPEIVRRTVGCMWQGLRPEPRD